MEPVDIPSISELRALIELSVVEEERLHAILDDPLDIDDREKALEQLARVLQNHRTLLKQLAASESL